MDRLDFVLHMPTPEEHLKTKLDHNLDNYIDTQLEDQQDIVARKEAEIRNIRDEMTRQMILYGEARIREQLDRDGRSSFQVEGPSHVARHSRASAELDAASAERLRDAMNRAYGGRR